jgi:hypothetical protein
MSDLAQLRSDLLAFSVAVEQPLADWQADSLALEFRTTVLVAPRQSGKSRSLSRDPRRGVRFRSIEPIALWGST